MFNIEWFIIESPHKNINRWNLITFRQIEDKWSVENTNIVLWWTPFLDEPGRIIRCGNYSRCFLTSNRKYKDDPRLKALLFYGSLFNQSDLPLERNSKLWGLLHEESPRNTPLLSHEVILSLFNYSSTFSRFSDLPLTLQYLPSLDDLTDQKYLVSFEAKSNLEDKLAPVVYIQSDCVTPNNRDSYVYELMNHINVDSYGECLNNKKLPVSLSNPLETMMSDELLHFVSKYKFAIAFENSVCDDYITEKLWRPLIAGTVPIYYGSPSAKDWLPDNDSAIFVTEFNSPKDLAEYLIFLANNSTAYNKHRKHKIDQKIANNYLIKKFRPYEWTTENDSGTIVEEFECLLCMNSFNTNISIVNKKHYDCPIPVSMVDRKYNISNWWHRDYHVTKCEALALRKFMYNIDKNYEKSETFTFNYIYNNDEICV
ncbi:GDP-fucose protein O-fucosyltransferase 3-like isoform X2 [Rhodnius prolixus]|uniref:GDP-fucose protein O-fucosyltransferase 3-like isoform X2 n=1 Tax=Rhodnius prolixus TaxID=13249 RepID=UPI003D18E76C